MRISLFFGIDKFACSIGWVSLLISKYYRGKVTRDPSDNINHAHNPNLTS